MGRPEGDTAILDVAGPGDLAGELEAVDGGIRRANVEALTRVEALVRAAQFRGILDDRPGSAWAVAAVLTERLRDANELRVAHYPDEPERRLASRLLRLVARFGSPVKREGPDGAAEAPARPPGTARSRSRSRHPAGPRALGGHRPPQGRARSSPSTRSAAA